MATDIARRFLWKGDGKMHHEACSIFRTDTLGECDCEPIEIGTATQVERSAKTFHVYVSTSGTLGDAEIGEITTHVGTLFDVPEDLTEWWLRTAIEDLQKSVPKITEYGGHKQEGSSDLMIMGDAQAELIGMHDAPDAVKQELACWFYALGKIARLVSDYKQGRPGKADTWFDLKVYSMMARRLQAVGRWP